METCIYCKKAVKYPDGFITRRGEVLHGACVSDWRYWIRKDWEIYNAIQAKVAKEGELR